MAIAARLSQHDEFVNLQFHVDQPRLRATDDPQIPDYDPAARLWFYWDDEKLELGQREFLGVEAFDVRQLTPADFRAIEYLNPPRINLPEQGLNDVSVVGALKWVRAQLLAPTGG